MAQDLERLVVSLSADIKKYENALNKAMGVTNRRAKQIESRFTKMNGAISAQFTRLGGALAGAFAGGAALQGAQQLIDTATRIENALKVTGLAGEELTGVYDQLFESAQRNAAPLEALVGLYGRASQAQQSLGVTTNELLGLTESVAQALRISGADAQTASGALLQLGQALAGGKVQAEEYGSLLDGLYPLLQAAAAGLKEAGGDVAVLTRLVKEGKVSSEAFFRAIEAGAPVLEQKLAGAETTVSQAFVRLQNVLIRTAGKVNEATGASDAAAASIDRLAYAVEALGDFFVRTANGPLGTFIGKLSELDEKARAVLGFLGGLSFNDDLLNIIAPEPKLTEDAIRDWAARNNVGPQVSTTPKTGRLTAAVNPVSLATFPVGDSGRGRSTRERADEYERLTQRINESIAAIQAETAAQAGLNPLVDDYGYTLEKARTQQDLLNAAKEAGKEITPALAANIEDLAHKYALAYSEGQKLAEAQDKIRERAEEWADVGKDVTGGFVQDLLNGASAADALSNALGKVADKLLNEVLDAIFQVNSAAGGGGGLLGFLGGLFGGGGALTGLPLGVGLYSKGGYTGAGGKYQPAGVVHKGEYVFSKDAVSRIGVGNLERLHRGYANGGLVAPSMPRLASPRSVAAQSGGPVDININVAGARGNQEIAEMVAVGVRQGLDQFSRQTLPVRVQEIRQDPRKRG